MENRKQDEENGAVACAALALAPIARVGDPITAIDTPALVLDMDAFEANVQTMQAWAARHGVALRPHAKAHRCPELSRRQLRQARWVSAAKKCPRSSRYCGWCARHPRQQ